MLTLFTVPKPFEGHIGDIQRNALESWLALRPAVEIILVGDERGVAQVAREAGVKHVSRLAQNERGTPRLDSAFERVETVASHHLRCLVNADIVLLDDFLPAVQRVAAAFRCFLLVGESRDLAVPPDLPMADSAVRARIREQALAYGRLRGYAALDYFVFPRDHFGRLPPFLIGRACFDNWLVWRARQVGPVVDATRFLVSVHQSHDYSHVPGGLDEAYYGDEAKWNERLAGGRSYIYSLHDATHRLGPNGALRRYWGSTLRARENARKTRVRAELKLGATRSELQARWAGKKRHPRPARVVGVFPEPSPYRTPLLDTVAELDGLDLSVLYAAQTEAGGTSPDEPRHTHWVMRGFRVPTARGVLGHAYRGVLGHAYPVNWAIWRALLRLRPDCVVVSGWSTFAAQAAIAWCWMRGIPYVLMIESHGLETRVGWRRMVKQTVVRRAAGHFVAGSLARESMLAHGARPERIRMFAGTTGVAKFDDRAEGPRRKRATLRAALGLVEADVAILCVGRLAPEQGLDTLLRAASSIEEPRIVVVLAGEERDRARLCSLAEERRIRLVLLGDVDPERVIDAYAAADVLALLSERETWGVVVNEGAACGLPLRLLEAVGSAHDVAIEGVNGRRISVNDVDAASAALKELAGDSGVRWRAGASRRIAGDFGYEQSAGGLVDLVRLALEGRFADLATKAASEPAGDLSRPAGSESLRFLIKAEQGQHTVSLGGSDRRRRHRSLPRLRRAAGWRSWYP